MNSQEVEKTQAVLWHVECTIVGVKRRAAVKDKK